MSGFPVYTGFWINWSRGQTLGATLTLTETSGNLLIAFAAFWATVVIGHIWAILCFALHCFSSHEGHQDGLYHQQQAILRNNSGPAASSLKLSQLIWAWRKSAPKSRLRKIFLLVALAFVTAISFAAVTGFSSEIAMSEGFSNVATADEVLISSPGCGAMDQNAAYSAEDLTTYINPYYSQAMSASANYAAECYTAGNSTAAFGCDTYVQSQLPFQVDTKASCPFPDKSLCHDDESNIVLDTGLLDSQTDLGLNTPPSQRFQYRSRIQCAPIKTEGYTSVHNNTDDRSNTRYQYGAQSGDFNYTYEYSNQAFEDFADTHLAGAQADYSIGVRAAIYRNGTGQPQGGFEPIAAMNRFDADIYMFFLSANGVIYTAETTDPWYKATDRNGILEGGYAEEGTTAAAYVADAPASPMACVDQKQFCNPNLPEGSRCAPLASYMDSLDMAVGLFSDVTSSRTLAWVLSTAFGNMVSSQAVPQTLGPTALTARSSLTGGFQGPLPDNQWQLDVQHWFATSLSTLQRGFVDTATGPNDEHMKNFQLRPSNPVEQALCGSQKIQSSGYKSFSVFGTFFIFGAGLLIIIISLSMESAAEWVQRRRRSNPYRLLEWTSNDTLQLQRMAHEELGVGAWSYGFTKVPVTERGVQLAALDISDPRLPRLHLPETPWAGPGQASLDSLCEGKRESVVVVTGDRSDDRHCHEMRSHLPHTESRVDEISPVSSAHGESGR